MMWWSGDMVGWLECVNMVWGWSGAMIFLCFLNGEIVIWCNGDMVKLSNGELFFGGHVIIDGDMVKRWNGE